MGPRKQLRATSKQLLCCAVVDKFACVTKGRMRELFLISLVYFDLDVSSAWVLALSALDEEGSEPDRSQAAKDCLSQG